MKRILGLAVVAMLIMGLVGGGTWAYFSDTKTTGTNVLTAGTLELTLGGTAPFSLGNLYPSSSNASVADWLLTNSGSISGNMSISMSAITNGEGANGVSAPELANGDNATDPTGELGTKVKVALWIDYAGDGWSSGDLYLKSDNTTVAYASPGLPTAAYEILNNFGGKAWNNVAIITAGSYAHFIVSDTWPDSGDATDNIAQGDNATFSGTFSLRQS